MKNVLVVSHERSGTHFLMNTIMMNFGYNNFLNVDEIDIREWVGKNTNKVFKDHHQFQYYEKIWDEIIDNFNVFYIQRNGKDVMTSSFHYHKKACKKVNFPDKNNFSEWLRTDPSGYLLKKYQCEYVNNMPRRWKNHINSWKDRRGVNYFTYEELLTDFNTQVQRISSILNIPLKNIKKPIMKKAFSINPRKGIIGDWENTFSDRDLKFFKNNTDG